MKIKQISLRAFEIDSGTQSDGAIWDYIQAQEAILRRFLLLFTRPLSTDLQERLKAAGFSIAQSQGQLVGKPTTRPNAPAPATTPSSRILDRPVRSGELIESEGDLIAFGRINSGAQLFIGGNATLFAPLDGMLSCDGEVAILHGVGRSGVVIFQGQLLRPEDLAPGAIRLVKRGDRVSVEMLQ